MIYISNMIYVYQLIDENRPVYVGVTKDPQRRFAEHVIRPKGLFYNQNLILQIIGEFQSRVEALKYEGRKKLEYGLLWTEHLNAVKNGSRNGKINGKIGGKKVGPIQGRKNVESGLLQSIASAGGTAAMRKINTIEYTCPRCNQIKKGPKFKRHINKGTQNCPL